MIPLTYTLTVAQESTLRHIEMLRAKLLSCVIPHHIERTLRWDSVIHTIQSGYSLATENVSIEHIERAVERRRSKSYELDIVMVWDAVQQVRETWAGSSEYLSLKSYVSLFATIRKRGTASALNQEQFQQEFQSALSYLASGHEHPIIQAAILMSVILHSGLPQKETAWYATIATYAVLTTHGYTCHDLYSPLFTITSDSDSLSKAIQSITQKQNLNHWILYITSRIELSLTDALERISHTSFSDREHANKYTTLTDRQKTILQLLEKPGFTVHNAFVQRRFGVSQLTASRDLMYLTKLGLISPHGKSRSTSYTRIG